MTLAADTIARAQEAITTLQGLIDQLRVLVPAHAATPPVVKPSSPWTCERKQAVRDNWTRPIKYICDLVNGLPGPDITARNITAYGLIQLKLPKRGSFIQVQVLPPPAQPSPTPASLPTFMPAPAPRPESAWSPRRVELLKRDFPTGRPAFDILVDLNQMPGPMLKKQDVLARAAALGLSSPPPKTSDPISTDFFTIQAWAAQRGRQFLGASDLPALNRHCAAIGHRPFELERKR